MRYCWKETGFVGRNLGYVGRNLGLLEGIRCRWWCCKYRVMVMASAVGWSGLCTSLGELGYILEQVSKGDDSCNICI
jgi:hypothetical protein